MFLSKKAQQLTDWLRNTLAKWFAPLVNWLALPEHREEWYSKHSPNIMTSIRGVVSALLLTGLFYNMHNYLIRSLLITILGFVFSLDGVDGMLATALNRRTKLGRVLDPAVDFATLVASAVFVYQLAWSVANDTQDLIGFVFVSYILVFHLLIWWVNFGRAREGDRLDIDIESLPLGKVKLVYPLLFGLATAYLPSTTYMPTWICWVVLMPTVILCVDSHTEYQNDHTRLRSL